jgi:hypothetical protein
MAGLFDFNNPEMRMGLGLLALGQMPKAQGFQGLMGLLANEGSMRQEAMREKLLQSQIEENAIQSRQREQQMALATKQQEMRDRMMFGGGATATDAAMPSATEAVSGSAGGIMGVAKQLNMPPEVVQADYVFNGGKKIAELLESRSKPNWVNIGGNLVNTNAQGFQGGIQDQVQLGPDGRAMMLRANNGNPIMGAIPGSFDTYAAFKDIDNRTSARYSPGRPVIGPDGRQYGQSQLDEIGGGAPRSMQQPGVVGRSGPTNLAERNMAAQVASVPYDLQREIASVQREIQGGNLNPADRAQAVAYLQQLQGQSSQSATGALDFSPAEKAAQEAARTRMVDTAKADVVRDTSKQSETKLANKLTTGVDRALELLQAGPTSSVMGNLVDKGLGVAGVSTKGGETAAQLEALSGWLVSNVPRMEGPQSNIDVQNYQTMAGRIGDRNLPIGVRKAAAEEVKRLQQKYAGLNGDAEKPQKTVVKTGMYGGRKVVQYSDGTVDYAN